MVNAWDKFVIFSGIIFHDGYEMLCYGLEIVHSVCRGNSPSFNRTIELNGLAYVWQAVKLPEAKRRSSVHLWDSQVGPSWFFGPCWIWRSKILRSESPVGWLRNSQLTTGRLGSRWVVENHGISMVITRTNRNTLCIRKYHNRYIYIHTWL